MTKSYIFKTKNIILINFLFIHLFFSDSFGSTYHVNIEQNISVTNDWDIIKKAIQKAPINTCVIFDIDNVLIDLDLLVNTNEYHILDPTVFEVLDLIKNKNFKAYALTHGGWGYDREYCYEDMRVDGLKSIGINFSFLSQHEGQFEIESTINSNFLIFWEKTLYKTALMKDGVIFSRDRWYDTLPKGEILFKALKIINENPEHIIFIDDQKYNLENMKNHCIINGVSFEGFEYLHLQNLKNF